MRLTGSSIAAVLALLSFGGCAGLMTSELRDGETMKRGEAEGAVRLIMVTDGAALFRDSIFDGGAESVAPALGVGGYIGLTDRLELNGSAWTSALFTAPVSFFRTVDVGVRGGVRCMITPRAWRHNLAVGVSGWWHGGMNLIVRFDDDLRYYGTAYGIDPSLNWSYRLSNGEEESGSFLRSIYLGGRSSFAHADYTYGYSGGDTAASVTVREYHGGFQTLAPFLGVRTSTDFFLEIGATTLRHPESKERHWIPSVGIGWRVGD